MHICWDLLANPANQGTMTGDKRQRRIHRQDAKRCRPVSERACVRSMRPIDANGITESQPWVAHRSDSAGALPTVRSRCDVLQRSTRA